MHFGVWAIVLLPPCLMFLIWQGAKRSLAVGKMSGLRQQVMRWYGVWAVLMVVYIALLIIRHTF
jgi:hypothetical protein